MNPQYIHNRNHHIPQCMHVISPHNDALSANYPRLPSMTPISANTRAPCDAQNSLYETSTHTQHYDYISITMGCHSASRSCPWHHSILITTGCHCLTCYGSISITTGCHNAERSCPVAPYNLNRNALWPPNAYINKLLMLKCLQMHVSINISCPILNHII